MLVGLVVACTSPPPPPDVILVTLDTTRADHLGAWGGSAATPALDRLAADGRRYDRAYSAIPLTIPSHTSLFTARWPPRTGVRANDRAMPGDLPTLTERLRDAGWATAAFVGATVTSRTFGFDRGFVTFDDQLGGAEERPGSVVVDRALAWEASTRADPAPRFVWVHLYDPHAPNPDGYDAALSLADAAVGRLRAGFDRRPTVFAVVGDHGEGLGDHGEQTHGLFVYPATQHVPWLLVGPGIAAGEVVPTPVSVVDVAPTLLALLGLPPLPDADGRSAPDPRPLYVESWQLAQRLGIAPHLGVIDGDDELVAVPKPELYDLRADPGALHDRAAAAPDRVKALQAALDGFGFGPPDAGPSTLDPAELQALQALGYVTAGPAPTGALPDPKDRADLVADVVAVEEAAFAGDPARTEPLAAAAAARWPDVSELHGWRAWALGALGRDDEAIAELRRGLTLNPGDTSVQLALAAKLAAKGETQEATNLYVSAALANAAVPRVREMAVLSLLDAGRPDLAEKLARALLERSPGEAGVEGLLGVALARQERTDEAVPLLEEGAAAEVPERSVLFQYAAILSERGDQARAAALLDRELAIRPDSSLALLARCGFHHAASEPAAMHALARKALEVAPSSAAALTCEAAASLDDGDRARAREWLDRALAIDPQLPEARGLDQALRAP